MMPLPKRLILGALDRLGYVLLKKADLEAMRGAVPAKAPQAAVAPAVVRRSANSDQPSHSAGAAARAAAVANAIRSLADAKVAGDIVDCGDGSPAMLATIAATLVSLGDVGRRLILFDVSGDPTHRAEGRLPLWGAERDLLARPAMGVDRAAPSAERLPAELLASGYPGDRMLVVRYPARPPDAVAPIAYLGVVPDPYPANRHVVAGLLPRLAPGGILAISGDRSAPSSRDVVEETLREQGKVFLLHQSIEGFRIGRLAASVAASEQRKVP